MKSVSVKKKNGKKILYAGILVLLIIIFVVVDIKILKSGKEADDAVTPSATDDAPAPVGVSLSDKSLEIGMALTGQLTASGGERIVYRSSDESVASVDQNGLVTGVSVGSCAITAENEFGSSDSCEVTVKKVCYLTIDDGPTTNTERILAVLKKHGVRATFFVVSSPQLYLTKNMEEQGCVVGLHTYSHRFYICYATQFTYFYGLDMLADEVEQYIGKRPKLIRFPGGTATTRCKLIWMRRNLNGAFDQGYTVYDWTAAAGDTSKKASAEFSFKNVKESCTEDEEILLIHDLPFTPDALGKIIPYLKKQGYIFETLDLYPHGSKTQVPAYSLTCRRPKYCSVMKSSR